MVRLSFPTVGAYPRTRTTNKLVPLNHLNYPNKWQVVDTINDLLTEGMRSATFMVTHLIKVRKCLGVHTNVDTSPLSTLPSPLSPLPSAPFPLQPPLKRHRAHSLTLSPHSPSRPTHPTRLTKIELAWLNTSHPNFIGGSRAVLQAMTRLQEERAAALERAEKIKSRTLGLYDKTDAIDATPLDGNTQGYQMHEEKKKRSGWFSRRCVPADVSLSLSISLSLSLSLCLSSLSLSLSLSLSPSLPLSLPSSLRRRI